MIRCLLSIYDKLSHRRWLAGLFLVACLVGCLSLASRMHYQEDIADFLPWNEQTEKYSTVYNHLGGQNKIVVIFSQKGSKGTNQLAEVMERFGAYWEEVDVSHNIADIQIHIDESKVLEMMDFIGENYPYFLTQEDYRRMDSLLSIPGYITNQLEYDKSLLMLPIGGVMTQNLRYDPLHLFVPIVQRLQSFNLSDQYQILDGYIFNKAGDKGLVFLSSPYGISESKQNEKLSLLIDTVIQKTETNFPEVSISAVGAPLIAVTNAQQIKKDSLLSVTLSVVLIFAVLIYSFRRLDDLFWIGASILFGWVFALGCIAVYKDSVSIIVLGIGSIIIGIAVNYPLHFLDHLKQEPDRRTALKEMISPLLIGNVTTVSAFLCLLFLNAEAMRDLGLFGSLTLIGTILFVLVFLPIWVSRRKSAESVSKLNLGKLIPFSEKRKGNYFFPIMVITIILSYFSFGTSFDSDIWHINYMTDQQRNDLNLLSTSIQRSDSTISLYAVAEGRNLQEALSKNEDLLKELDIKIQSRQILQISGIGNFIPSVSRQEERLKEWTNFWETHGNVIKEFEHECSRLGFSKQAFSPFLESVTTIHEPQNVDYFNVIMQSIGENYIMIADSVVRIANYVQSSKKISQELKNALSGSLSSGCFVFDAEDVNSQLVSVLSDNFNFIGFVCGFAVLFFLWISFGRLELSFLSFLPLAVSWIWILGIMQILGIQFNIVNIILATFIFGQGDDYTIFITEGLIYEYAYGKKILASYKNSVALSAVIMLIGMGMLIFSKHPAMKSLAEVAVIGMLVVVAMAYYLPPLIFRWVTTSKGVYRQVPLTLKRIGYSLFSLLFFLIGTCLFMIPLTCLYFHMGKVSERKRMNYHQILRALSEFVIKHVPGVGFSFNNAVQETFDKPAVIICNHQSHLDLMCIMMLTPKLVILTNDWVWKNPFYGMIIKYAEFYPISDGIDMNERRLQSLMNRGYSVIIFPEGTRSEDCSILRFHQGAFYLAEKLNVDILPVFIHGTGHVLSKKDFMLREGNIYMEIGKRMSATEIQQRRGAMKLASQFHKIYSVCYKEICNRCENTNYFMSYVRYKYMYKGYEVETRCKKTLHHIKSVSSRIDCNYQAANVVWLINSGQGEFAWLFALVHKNVEVYAFERDKDLHLLALNTVGIPHNLHFVHLINDATFQYYPEADENIDVKNIIHNVTP